MLNVRPQPRPVQHTIARNHLNKYTMAPIIPIYIYTYIDKARKMPKGNPVLIGLKL